MKYKRKKIYLILGIALVALASISVGYAALSTTMSASIGSVTQSSLKWDINFIEKTYQPIRSNGTSCSDATVNGTRINTGQIELSEKDDLCVYEFQIKNDGDIAGRLQNVRKTYPETEGTCTISDNKIICENITFNLKQGENYDTAEELSENFVVEAGETHNIYLEIKYTNENSISEDEKIQDAQYELNFIQK